jgi:hypothetical protein
MMHSQGNAIMRLSVRLLLSCLLLPVSACATPIGVARVNTQSVYRSLTASMLSAGRPSAATEQVLVRTGSAQRFKDDPEATLAVLRGTGVGLSRDRLFALAKLSFVHAEGTHKPEYYLAAAVYAYAFLLPSEQTVQTVPLELEPSATLAYVLEGAPVWATELSGFLSANRRPFPEGLAMLHPYRRGRVPVVLIHGTVSSPARWADMLNELQNDPVLRGHIQFWLFTYNTSNPILRSASELREALRKTIAEIDPGHLRRMALTLNHRYL